MPIEYRLHALAGFRCLGGKCPGNCCTAKWHINVDDETLQRWQLLPEEALRRRLLESVRPEQERDRTVNRFVRTDTGACVHLDDQGLCGVQQQLGHENIPKICREYPRQHAATAVTDFISATLSCPEMARLVATQSPSDPLFLRSGSAPPPGLVDWNQQITIALLQISEQLIQADRYPLPVRITVLAQTLAALNRLLAESRLQPATLEKMSKGIRQALYDTNVRLKKRRAASDPELAGFFWQLVYHIGSLRDTLPEPGDRAARHLIATLQNAPAAKGAAHAEIYRALQEVCGPVRNVLQERLGQSLARVFFANLLNKQFPWKPYRGNYIVNFLYALLPHAALSLRLWLAERDNGPLDTQALADHVWRVERVYGHGATLLDLIDQNPQLLRIDLFLDCLADL